MKLQERDLVIDFTDAVDAIVFDQINSGLPNYHDISEMHRVDFVVELDKDIVFVEIKDPCNPNARAEGLAKFQKDLNDGTLSSTFASKFIDSFFYRWPEDKLSKTVHYLCLVTLETGILLNLSDEIARQIPASGKNSSRWLRHPIQNCQVFNIETWNENFPKWPVTRSNGASAAVET